MKFSIVNVLLAAMLASCTTDAPSNPDTAIPLRPMDEVPQQLTASNGNRLYRFANGCVVTLQPTRAVLVEEGARCELHHRDIALLYASGD